MSFLSGRCKRFSWLSWYFSIYDICRRQMRVLRWNCNSVVWSLGGAACTRIGDCGHDRIPVVHFAQGTVLTGWNDNHIKSCLNSLKDCQRSFNASYLISFSIGNIGPSSLKGKEKMQHTHVNIKNKAEQLFYPPDTIQSWVLTRSSDFFSVTTSSSEVKFQSPDWNGLK